MIDSRNPKDLHPILEVIASEFITTAKEKNLPVSEKSIVSTYRDHEQQNYYYNVTKTTTVKGGYSYHNHRLAVDIVPLNGNGQPYWPSMSVFDWTKLGVIGEELGLEWGGRWTSFVDMPHYQLTFGLTCANIVSGKPIPKTIAKGCPDAKLVKLIQRLVNITADGVFGVNTEAAVKNATGRNDIDAIALKILFDKRRGAYTPTPIETPKPPAQEPSKPEVKTLDIFKDVPADHWSAEAFIEMHKRGLISGYNDNNGNPIVGFGKPIETERIVQLLWNIVKLFEKSM